MQSSVCGVIVTFNPTEDFLIHLDALREQVTSVTIVDNGSTGSSKSMLSRLANDRKVYLLSNDSNLGVAKALNQGFHWAKEKGFNWVLSMDQDSFPAKNMVKEMLEIFYQYPHRDKVVIVSPQVSDPQISIKARYLQPRLKLFFKRATCEDDWLDDISIVITSGSLHNLKAYEMVGIFREDFFIDYVDTEYCLRAVSKGYKIIVACNARLYHRLGNRRRVQIGPLVFYPTFHSPDRWYYLGRNRIPMIRAYGCRFPHWLLYDFIAGLYGLSRMLLFEDAKRNKLGAFFCGIRHGLQGRMGKMS
jgi:rhamnosyltransferase